jgi:ABC-type transport system substrate-binding protein
VALASDFDSGIGDRENMLSNRTRVAIATFLVAGFLLMSISPIFVTAQTLPYSGLPSVSKNGPYIDKMVFKVQPNTETQMFSLMNGEVDMIWESSIDTTYLPQLAEAENVEAYGDWRNGFGFYTFNCDRYPLNITNFRRAYAYALDKYDVSEVLWAGESRPWDAAVPPGPWTINDDFTYYYYQENLDIAERLLDDANIVDIDADGWRENPDGSEIGVVQVAGHADDFQSSQAAIIGANTLESIGIEAEPLLIDFYQYVNKMYFHEPDWQIVFSGYSFREDFRQPLYSLYDDYYGGYYHVDYYNVPNFRNSTYDALADAFVDAKDEETAFDLGSQMQDLLHYQCPRVIAYNNKAFSAIRTDKWEGHVSQLGANFPNFWTSMKVHLKESAGGPYGGTFYVSSSLDIDSFNVMSAIGYYSWAILFEMWPGLVEKDENADYVGVMAESWEIQTHDTDPDIVPAGHHRFVFNLIQNATWSDGQPITAEDFAWTFNYYKDGLPFGNPSGATETIQHMTAAYAASPFQFVVELDRESFWNFENVAFRTFALPKHIIQSYGLDGWNVWDPVKGGDPYVVPGPFTVTEYIDNEFTELTARTDWAYGFEHPEPTTTTTTPPPTTGPTNPPPFDPTLAIIGGAVGAAVVILVGGFVLLRQK